MKPDISLDLPIHAACFTIFINILFHNKNYWIITAKHLSSHHWKQTEITHATFIQLRFYLTEVSIQINITGCLYLGLIATNSSYKMI